MLEAAEKQEVKRISDPGQEISRATIEEQICRKLPFYDLIERVRIHDFHRFGILPPDPGVRQVMIGGPIKLTAKKGAAAVFPTARGLVTRTTGASEVKQQRPLVTQDGAFFDEQSSKYVDLEKLLEAFLREAPDIISEFEQDLMH